MTSPNSIVQIIEAVKATYGKVVFFYLLYKSFIVSPKKIKFFLKIFFHIINMLLSNKNSKMMWFKFSIYEDF
ncbi:MAG: hypothetical protein CND83_03000 [Rhodothermaeota bacterium MED-G19]|nr:MAG: hypothetical protein CND83_03000 [Rhodothermaeota bacterium MED-G19]